MKMKVQYQLLHVDGSKTATYRELASSKEIYEEAHKLSCAPNIIDVKYYLYKGESEGTETLRKAVAAIQKYVAVSEEDKGLRAIFFKYHEAACINAAKYIKDAEKFYETSYMGHDDNIIELFEYLKEYMNTLLKDIQYVFKVAGMTSITSTTVPEQYIRHNFDTALKIAKERTGTTGTLHALVLNIKERAENLKNIEYIDSIINAYNRIYGRSFTGFEGGDVEEYVRKNIDKAYEYGSIIYGWISWYLGEECEGYTLSDYAHNILQNIDDLIEAMWSAIGISDCDILDTY